MSTLLWTTTFLAPLAAVALLLAGARHDDAARWARRVAPWSLLPGGALSLLGADRVGQVDLGWLLLGTHLALDPMARILLLVAVLLYAAALVAAGVSGTRRATALTAFLLVCAVGTMLLLVAADAVTFYLGFALMSLSAYPLVVHERTPAAMRAGRVYLVLTMVSEMAVLAGLMLVVQAGGRMVADAPAAVAGSGHAGAIVALLLLGFGIKAGTVPLHVWLPLAHPAAPPPASAVLSGIMIKAGLVGWLRFLPLGEIAMPGWGTTLVVLAIVGAFAALLPGLLQDDAKVALAYSSISQMGFLAALVGSALTTPELADACTAAAVLYAVHHGLAKGGLFLGVTVWRTHGEGWVRWWVIGGLGLLALAVAGAPLSSGAVAKYAAKEAVAPFSLGPLDLAELLPLVGTVSTVLLLRAGFLLLTGSRDRAWGVDGALLAWTVLAVGGTVVTWVLAERWAPVVAVPGLAGDTVWAAVWPILLGVAAAGLVLAGLRVGRPAWLRHAAGWRIAPGDVLIPEESLLTAGARRTERALVAATGRRDDALQALAARLRRRRGPVALWALAEERLAQWRGSGVAVLVTVAVAAVAVALLVWLGAPSAPLDSAPVDGGRP